MFGIFFRIHWIFMINLFNFYIFLDRQEFLQWVLEMVEKYRKPDADSWIAMRIGTTNCLYFSVLCLLKKFCTKCNLWFSIVLPVVLTYAKEMCQTETLSRKMAYQCAKKIYYLVEESEAISNNQNDQTNTNMHPVVSAFLELTNDQYTRFIILGIICQKFFFFLNFIVIQKWNSRSELCTSNDNIGMSKCHGVSLFWWK